MLLLLFFNSRITVKHSKIKHLYIIDSQLYIKNLSLNLEKKDPESS